MGAKLGGGGGAVSDINMTPLIDIVLVVLIIMMVNMPIQIEEMGVKLPGVSDKPPPRTDTPA
jgi:biopolymer transport protein ExbD